MKKNDLYWLERHAKDNGLRLERYSPGDGMTRYQFYRNGTLLFVGLGFSEARIALNAYLVGLYHGRENKE